MKYHLECCGKQQTIYLSRRTSCENSGAYMKYKPLIHQIEHIILPVNPNHTTYIIRIELKISRYHNKAPKINIKMTEVENQSSHENKFDRLENLLVK